MIKKYHAFICHASEDKIDVISPITEEFDRVGISYWVDDKELKWGNSITQSVNKGLSESQFVIVVISEGFLQKNWPNREFNAVMNEESSSGLVRVLPLIVGDNQTRRNAFLKYPLLNDKVTLIWDGDATEIARNMQKLLENDEVQIEEVSQLIRGSSKFPDVPMPHLVLEPTQRQLDKFIKTGYETIRDYFENGVSQLNDSNSKIEAEFEEVTSRKFVCSFYNGGKCLNRCKIWLGGMIGASVSFAQGPSLDIEADSSMNDWITIENRNGILGFVARGFSQGPFEQNKDKLMSAVEAAEYFWKESIRNY